jgi:hypothetical protein
MTEYGYRGPTIDHGLLSPSGKVSKRARKAFLDREVARLFDGCDLDPAVPQPSERDRLLAHAARLRDMADRGMSSKRYRRLAAEAEAQAAALP